MPRSFFLLAAVFLFNSCIVKDKLSGTALREAVKSYLDGDAPSPSFTGDLSEIRQCVRAVLSEGSSARTGQDTAYITGPDGKRRALGLHVPLSYAPGKPAPVVLWLHGGVNGTRQDRGAEVAHYFSRESDSLNFIFAAMSGEQGATWFDKNGIRNIQEAVRYLKRRFDVDDDRVILAGVSDGGTGCYVSGMHYPADFAGYIVCSASPDMLPAFGIAPLFPNMRLARWLIVHGGRDHLYPGQRVREYASLFESLRVPFVLHYYDSLGHGLDYMPREKAAIMDFIRDTRRTPLPPAIEFLAASPLRVSWISADSLSGNGTAFLRAEKAEGTLTIRAGGVRKFSVYPAEPLFRPGEEVEVLINGKSRGRRRCGADTGFLLAFARSCPDKALLPFCTLAFDIKDK